MAVRRGDIVSVSLPGEYGKPRPALVIQSDLFEDHPSVTVLPITSEIRDAPITRIRVSPDDGNALRKESEVMVDKAMTVARGRVGPVFGRLSAENIREIERGLALFLGLAK